MMLAALSYIYRISQTTTVLPVTVQYIESGRTHILQGKRVSHHMAILPIRGPFLFGTTERLIDATKGLKPFGAVVIADRLRKSGRTLLLCGARDQPATLLRSSDFTRKVGSENVLPHGATALERAGRSTLLSAEWARKSPVNWHVRRCRSETILR